MTQTTPRPLPLKQRQVRLSTIVVIPFVIQVVGVVSLVGWLSFRNGEQAINDLVNQLMREVSGRIEDRVITYLNEAEAINTLNANNFEEDLLPDEDLRDLSQYFWRQMQQFPRMTYIYWGDEVGRFAGSGRDAAGNLSIGITQGTTQVLYPANDVGRPLGPPIFEGLNYDPRSRPWYTDAVEAGEPTWSSVYIWSDGSAISIDAVQPVYRDGDLLGVAAISLGLVALSDFLGQLEIGQTGEAFIIEPTGEVVANSTPSPPFLGGSEGQDPARLLASESESELVQAATAYLNDHLEDLTQITDPIQLEFRIEGQRQYLEVLPFERGETVDWLIVVAVPASDFMAQIIANTRNTLFLAIAALGVAIMLGFWTTQQILRPVVQLMEGSEAIAGGNLSQPVAQGSRILELERLATTFNSMAEQLKHLFETLEDRVAERTTELAEANAEIKQLNTRLQAENTRLGTEIEVARQLQKLVLPKANELSEIQGIDISGYMEPADEVGGDYYDVLFTDGIVTLAIGDVTGHGLESGILMLMTQTAVRTLQESQEQDPVRFLDTLNRTIYKNVQRMDSDKTITLSVLNYSNGALSISGQHEETLIVRASGQIERINTIDLGFPIGLEDPITNFINQTHVELAPGDGLVLYTDGITEAENVEGEHYEMDRLCDTISRHWSLSAAQIQQAIVASVKQFISEQKIYDDITLLILKRLT